MYKYIPSNASIIRINRGDSFQSPLFINAGTILEPKRYILDDTEKVYFGLMEPNKIWEQSILRKIYTNQSETSEDGDLLIKLTPEDTQYLVPGTYYYMIKLVKYKDTTYSEIDEVQTVVPTTLFYLM